MTIARETVRRRWTYAAAAAAAIVTSEVFALSLVGETPQWGTAALRGILFALVATGGLWLAIVDYRTHLLPNAIVGPLAIAVSTASVFLAILSADLGRLLWVGAGAGAMALFYLLLGLGGGVGLGDVKLAAVLGMYLGWYGWEAPVSATIAAYLFAAPQAIAVLVIRRRHPERNPRIAFGPYLIAGAVVAAVAYLGL